MDILDHRSHCFLFFLLRFCLLLFQVIVFVKLYFLFLVLLVLQEFFVKIQDRVEVVSMIGFYGFLVSLCEMYPFCYRIF